MQPSAIELDHPDEAKLAQQLGLRIDEGLASGFRKPALRGPTRGFSDVLVAHGGKWNRWDRCYTFLSWEHMRMALEAVIAKRDAAGPAK